MLRKTFFTFFASAICGLAANTQAALVHESTFNSATGTDPVVAGDVSHIWAVDGDWTGGTFGYYHYTGGGYLQLHHPAHNWDDPYFELDTSALSNPVGANDPIEFRFKFVPEFEIALNEFVEILVTDANSGNNGTDAKTNTDIILQLECDNDNRVQVHFGPDSSNLESFLVPVKGSDITDVEMVLNHDPTAGQWRAFYSINGGNIKEAPGSPLTKARAKSTLRVECEMAFVGSNELAWDLFCDNLEVYNTVETTDEVIVAGETLFRSFFDEPAGVPTDPFHPLKVGYLDQMYLPTGTSQAYDGESWRVFHPGTINTNPNAAIQYITSSSDSAEWVVDVDPNYPNDGDGQMFNAKFDGNDVAFYVSNVSGVGEGVNIIFGEQIDIFNPDPSNVAELGINGETLTDLQLICNYDADTQTFRGFYSVNGGSPQEHPGSPIAKARTDTSVEFQWQVWNASDTTAFDIGIADYQEIWGVVTDGTGGPSSVEFFMLYN